MKHKISNKVITEHLWIPC